MKEVELKIILFVILTCITKCLSNLIDLGFEISKLQKGPEELSIPGFIELVERHGYPAEEHKITTPDGYKLRIHRIPGSPTQPKAPGKPVVYIQHGSISSSPMFVLAGPDRDLAYLLADAGYDVWLGNTRGNSYSRDHVKLSPVNNIEFWEFSQHEIAIYDITSIIDHILNETNEKSLVYVGHSMGAMMSLILLSTKPEYKEKVHLVINLATPGNFKKPQNIARILRDYSKIIMAATLATGLREILPQTSINVQLSNSTCRDGNILQQTCIDIIQFLSGYNPNLIDTNLVADGIAYFPAGGSWKTLFHFIQNIKAGKLQMYDYGPLRNLLRYKQLTPPAYDIESIETPIFLFYGKGDVATPSEDSLDLERLLKNARAIRVPHEEFSHLDFLWAKDIKNLLQDRIIEIIKASPKSAKREDL